MKNIDRDAFHRLAVAQKEYDHRREWARSNYAQLFNALALELGWNRDYLGYYLGFGPVASGGNKIMAGEAEPSNEDIAKLLES